MNPLHGGAALGQEPGPWCTARAETVGSLTACEEQTPVHAAYALCLHAALGTALGRGPSGGGQHACEASRRGAQLSLMERGALACGNRPDRSPPPQLLARGSNGARGH